jgi:hypothetical protein
LSSVSSSLNRLAKRTSSSFDTSAPARTYMEEQQQRCVQTPQAQLHTEGVWRSGCYMCVYCCT